MYAYTYNSIHVINTFMYILIIIIHNIKIYSKCISINNIIIIKNNTKKMLARARQTFPTCM